MILLALKWSATIIIAVMVIMDAANNGAFQ